MQAALPESSLTDEELQALVEAISWQFFQQPFRHQARFNHRLKTTGGRYHLASHNLDFNPQIVLQYGSGELEKVIKHELCHYHLHLAGQGYRHRDRDFKELLMQTGGSRYVQPLTQVQAQYYYQCQACQAVIIRKRRLNTTRYVCGKCGGSLQATSFTN
ncbi:SprT family protein [Enterococcus faecalis]